MKGKTFPGFLCKTKVSAWMQEKRSRHLTQGGQKKEQSAEAAGPGLGPRVQHTPAV